MKLGKVSQTVYRRSILKQLHTDKDVALIGPSQEECCYAISTKEEELVLNSDVSLYGNEKDLCVFAIAQAVNHLAAKGAEAKGVSIQIMLPDYAFESRVKAMIAFAEEVAEEHGLQILKADAQIVPGIATTIVHVSAAGTIKRENYKEMTAVPGQEIVLLNYMGLEGTLRIKRAKEEELAKRFIPAFLDRIETYKNHIFAVEEMKTAAARGVSAMHQIVDGGIMAALWNLAESAGIGLSVDMRKIAVKQETIEVCECFHLNPYQLTSAGAILVVTDKGEELVDTLQKEGMQAVVIGHTVEGKERVVFSGGEKRYLDRPAPDELTMILANKAEMIN